MSPEAIGPKRLPPEIEALVAEHGDIRNIPIEKEYSTPEGPKVVKKTLEEWMVAFCPEDPSEISDEEFEEAAVNILLGRPHGQETA